MRRSWIARAVRWAIRQVTIYEGGGHGKAFDQEERGAVQEAFIWDRAGPPLQDSVTNLSDKTWRAGVPGGLVTGCRPMAGQGVREPAPPG